MLKITKPIPCPYCGKNMNTYRLNKKRNCLLFTCTFGHTTELTEVEYSKLLKRQ